MELLWVGGPTVVLQLGAFRILSDPMLGESFVMRGHPSTGEDHVELHRQASLPPVQLDDLDLILVSHLHTDHFDPTAMEVLPKNRPLVSPSNQAVQLSQAGFSRIAGLDWWQIIQLEKKGETLRITAVPARHGVDDQTNADLGIVNGYVLEHSGGGTDTTVYWTGDTVWFEGLDAIQKRIGRTDLLIPHMGAVGVDGPWGRMTLDAVEGARLIDLFEPGTVIPIHHHTFGHYLEPISALQHRLRDTPYAGRLVILAEGEAWRSDGRRIAAGRA